MAKAAAKNRAKMAPNGKPAIKANSEAIRDAVRKAKEEHAAGTRRFINLPQDVEEPSGPLVRIHAEEDLRYRHRIVEIWTRCVKPWSVPSDGCRIIYRDFYVEINGQLRRAAICLRKECNYPPKDSKGADDDGADDDSEA